MAMGAEQRGTLRAQASERITPDRGEITARKLRHLVEFYKPRLGDFEVSVVGGNAGFIVKKVRPQETAITRQRDVLLGDFDDAIGATTAIKGGPNGENVGKPTHFERYKQLVTNLGVDISDNLAKTVIDKSDAFVRWEHAAGGGKIHHHREYAAVLTWATRQLLGKDPSEMENAVEGIASTLDRIKAGERESSDPFHFNTNGQLVMTRINHPWMREMEELIMNTMIRPPYYQEVLCAMKQLQQSQDGMDLIGMTHGDPTEQLRKFFELMSSDPEFTMEEIWLTQVGKGDFVRQAAKEKRLRKSVYVHFDDSPVHIAATVAANEHFGGMLSVRDETKEGKNLLQGKTQIPQELVDQGRVVVLRFGKGNVTVQNIVDQVQLVRANNRNAGTAVPYNLAA